MKLEKIRFLANFGLKKDLDGLPETTLQCSQHKKVVFNVSRLVLLRRQKRRLVQAPQAPFKRLYIVNAVLEASGRQALLL